MKTKTSLWNNKWLWTLILLFVAVLLSSLQPLQFVEGGEFTLFSMLALVLVGYFFGGWKMTVSTALFIVIRIALDWPFPNLKIDAEIADYIFGYGALIIGGIIAHRKNNLVLGYIVASSARYLESVINCLMFHYIPTDTVRANLIEAFGYSALYVATEAIVTLGILFIPKVKEAIDYWKYVSNNDLQVDLDTY